MENIIEIAKELQSESSKLGKLDILKREKDNEDFKQFIKFTLDPMHIYGLQAKKLKKFLNKTNGESKFNHLFEVFEYLLENNTGRDRDAELVAQYIDSVSLDNKELQDFYVKAITKTLRMGIDKTVNKAWGKGFLNEFNLMLAKDFYKEMHKIKGQEFTLTEKIDGQRAAFVVNDERVKVFSRQGKAITGLADLEKEFSKMPDGVYDGELLIKNEELYKDRAVLQETLKLSRKDGNKTDLNFHVFDCLTLEDFDDGKSKYNYSIRRVFLDEVFKGYNKFYGELKHIKLLPVLYNGSDLSVIPELLKQLENDGKEGLMLNLNNAIYDCKRSGNILKIKSMKTMDIRVIGFEEGEGKYAGLLGNLVLDYRGYELRSGSGLSDADRKEIWYNKEKYLGKIAEIQYFRASESNTGNLSVSFPVFKMWREDKNEPSYH